MSELPVDSTVAAVDLGSNSFHLTVARVVPGGLEQLDKLKERVALAEGLGRDKTLMPDVWSRALGCLRRFGERIGDLPRSHVRAVGTATLRKARNSREFLEEAEHALGHRIEIVAGHEEARIVYLGVASTLGFDRQRRLVVDIGGASTELIVGEGKKPLERDSVSMGCVRFGLKHFPGGRIDAASMEAARVAARIQLRGFERRYRELGWAEAVGSSGTVKAVGTILRSNHWSDGPITLDGIRELEAALVSGGRADRLSITGLDGERKPVIAPGLAILRGVFEGLRIDSMTVSPGALRSGLLHDLIRRGDDDPRDATIALFQARYGVDVEHARRVEATALRLFFEAAPAWGMGGGAAERFLRWAARLHEIGLSVAHSGYHRHGAYLIRNSAMAGFSRDDQEMLAALVLGHRRRVTPDRLSLYLPPGRMKLALRLVLCLRVACRLLRKRSPRTVPDFSMEVEDRRVELRFPEGWLEEHHLTRADLDDERQVLRAAGFDLRVT